MRTVQEIDLERAAVYQQRQDLNRRLTELDVERAEAVACARFALKPAEERDAFVARVEADEAARLEAERLAQEEADRIAAEEAAAEEEPVR